jgi:hypothetical protein
MKIIRVFLLLLTTAAIASAQSTCEQLVPKALELYGCLETLKGYPQQTAQQIATQASQHQELTAAQRQEILDTISKAISVDRLIKNVETPMIATCNVEEMTTLLEQLQTPLVQKMTKMESASTDPAMGEKIQNAMKSPAVQSPPEKRSVLVKRLVNTTGTVDTAVNTVVETSKAMMDGIGAPAPTAEQVAQMRQQVEAGVSQNINQLMLATYADASDEELEKYVNLLTTKPFRDFNEAYAKAMVDGFASESRQIGIAMRKLADEKRAKAEAERSKANAPKSDTPPETPKQ